MSYIASELNRWVLALLVVKFDEKHGQQVQSISPPQILPQSMVDEIKMLSMPDCMEPGAKHEFQFMVRVRNKSRTEYPYLPAFLNCYTSFRQCPDSSTNRGYFQQSIVLVSRLSFVSLFYNILTRLSSVLVDIPGFEEMLSSRRNAELEQDGDCNYAILEPGDAPKKSKIAVDPTSGILDATLEVGFQHFIQWPSPEEGRIYRLPFYGNMISFKVPCISPYFSHQQHPDMHHKSLIELLQYRGLEERGGIFHSINVLAVLGRAGLLPHIWTLWEVLITGQDVVVWSPCAAVCSAVVTALASLISPLAYSGDIRPYINPYDSDVNLLANATREKYQLYSRQFADCMKLTPLQLAYQDHVAKPKPKTMTGDNDEDDDDADGVDDETADVGTANSWIWTDPRLDNVIDSFVDSGASEFGNKVFLGGDAAGTSDAPTEIQEATLQISRLEAVVDPIASGELAKHREKECYVESIGTSSTGTLPGMLIGFTNPFLLKSFSRTHCAILLPNPELDRSKPDKRNSTPGASSAAESSSMASLTSYFRTFSVDISPASTPSIPSQPSPSLSLFSSMNMSSYLFASTPSPPPVMKSMGTSGSGCAVSGDVSPGRGSLFSPMRIDVGTSRKKAKADDLAEAAFPTHMKLLSIHDSIEDCYDQWIEAGGLHRKTFHGILCVRNTPTILPDKEVQKQLLSLPTAVGSTIKRHETENDLNGDYSGNADIDFESERTVVGNMILRQYFGNMTLSLTKPFESFFKPVALLSGSSATIFNSSFSFASSSNKGPISGAMGRVGGSSMILYSNPLQILGKANIYQSVAEFSNKEYCESGLSRSLRKADWKAILLAFGKSSTFRAWCRWRRELECLRLVLLSSQACVNLTANELMSAYSVEQGSEHLSRAQLKQLLVRIAQTIKALYIIDHRYFPSVQRADSTDLGRQATRRSCYDDRDVGEAAASATFTSSSPGDLIYLMKRHFASICSHIRSFNPRTAPTAASNSCLPQDPVPPQVLEKLELLGGDRSWGVRGGDLDDSDDNIADSDDDSRKE